MPAANPVLVVARRHIEGTVDRADHLDEFMAPSVGNQPVIVPITMDLPKLGDYFNLSQFFWHFRDQLLRICLHKAKRRQGGLREALNPPG